METSALGVDGTGEGVLRIAFVAFLLSFVVMEWLWGRTRGRQLYERNETLGTLGVMLGGRISRALALPFQLALYAAVAPWAVFELPSGPLATPLVFVAAIVAFDFVYYWHHRFSHTVPLLWALHQTHHSAERINLLAAARLNWLGPWVLQPLLTLPLVFLGFPPEAVVLAAALDLVFQFFLHTELVGSIPGLEGWVNTPRAHRVHHATNPTCLDRNFGGMSMVWDRLFGTWAEPPAEPLTYGLTTGPVGNNPLWIVFGGVVSWMGTRSSIFDGAPLGAGGGPAEYTNEHDRQPLRLVVRERTCVHHGRTPGQPHRADRSAGGARVGPRQHELLGPGGDRARGRGGRRPPDAAQ